MTPAQKEGIKKGQHYRVLKSNGSVRAGAIVTFFRDNKGVRPLFQVLEGDCSLNMLADGKACVCIHVADLEPVEKEETMTNEKSPDVALMREITKAMEEDPENWFKRFQFFGRFSKKWNDCLFPNHIWHSIIDRTQVRLKPQTYTLHIEDMPVPLSKEPEIDQVYWVLHLLNNTVTYHHWCDTLMEKEWLNQGCCFATKLEAREALLKLSSAMEVR